MTTTRGHLSAEAAPVKFERPHNLRFSTATIWEVLSRRQATSAQHRRLSAATL